MKKGKILVVDDNQGIRSALKILLPAHNGMVDLTRSDNECTEFTMKFR